ncbi:MAG: type II toxin-antitoxin system VapC family toxin [Turneriella sp.]|nr:type II toxin-antitoxin system VapC family toxin [Turneriella sp.]
MILLDTHTLLWYTHKPEELSPAALAAVEKARSAVAYVSAATFWEIALKVAKGQLPYVLGLPGYRHALEKLGFLLFLPVDEFTFIDAVMLKIPHRDPVDRILIATARRKNLKIVSCDPIIRKHYRRTVW